MLREVYLVDLVRSYDISILFFFSLFYLYSPILLDGSVISMHV
jgi:hypothetical protein